MILLLGTKEEISDAEPIERPKFIEDMNESELASAVCTLTANKNETYLLLT